jgi:hypothetical protein
MLTESTRSWQAEAVAWVSHMHIASVAVLVLALAWIYFESRSDDELRAELGHQKPSAGLLMAGVAVASALVVSLQLEGDRVSITLRTVVYFAVLWVLTCGVAQLLRHGMEDLDEHLQDQFQLRALLFRMGLLNVMATQALLLIALNADVVDAIWGEFSPFADSGTPFLALTLGVLAPFALNLLVPFQVANARLHHNLQTNSLERLFYRAAIESSLVQVTLTDGKVYVGWVDRLPPNPASPDAYLQLLPITSGYRDKDTKSITFTTPYDQIYEKEEIDLVDFMKVLPIANIDSAGAFREDIYLQFVKASASQIEPTADANAPEPLAPETVTPPA